MCDYCFESERQIERVVMQNESLVQNADKFPIQTGEAVEAVNAEFREVRSLFQAAYPNHPLPSESAIKRYIREARGSS